MFCKICSGLTALVSQTASFHTFHRFYQTHYQVLNLSNNCTPQEIRSAFIKLSKEYHPDVNKSKESHVKFQQINEAYAILGKPHTRRSYDLGMSYPDLSRTVNYPQPPPHTKYRHVQYDPHRDPLFWNNRNKSEDKYYDHPYYGINGVPRLPNTVILMFCVFFGLVSFAIQLLLITNSATLKREDMIRKSLINENVLYETKLAASNNGNQTQLEALKKKLLQQSARRDEDDK